MTSGGRGWAKHYSDEGDRFIQSLDVQMGSISARDPVFVVPPDNAEARRTRTAVGDVLLTITGSRIGRVAALPAALAGSFVSQHVAILRPDPQVTLPYLYLNYPPSETGAHPEGARVPWLASQTDLLGKR